MKKSPKNKRQQKATTLSKPSFDVKKWGIALAIVAFTFAVFYPSLHNEFTNWDDNFYVTQNILVTDLSVKGLQNIFTQAVAGNYHPLTILSLAANYQVAQFDPLPYHTTNLVLHLLNTLLVFLFILLLTRGKMAVAIITSLLFGIHPMHVESVAWVAERKDVLYTFFFLGGLIAYVKYLGNGFKKSWLGLTFLLFVCSVLSKPAAVVFPVVMLLISYFLDRKWNKQIIFETLPFFILSIVMGIVTLNMQSAGNAIGDLQNFTIIERILYAGYGFVMYPIKLIAPLNLSAFYPYPSKSAGLPILAYLSPLLIAGLGALVWYSLRKTKVVAFGILFYLITIALVLQLLQVGSAMLADRYTYVPYIGLFFIIGYGFHHIWHSSEGIFTPFKYPLLALLIGYSTWVSYLTVERCKVWQTSETMWSDVIEQYPQTWGAYYGRGSHYFSQNKFDLAKTDFMRAIAINSNYHEAHYSLANIHRQNKELEEALKSYNTAIEIDPSRPEPFINRGNLYMDVDWLDNAVKDYTMAINLRPDYVLAYTNRGFAYLRQNNYDAAIADYTKAIQLHPPLAVAYYNRSLAYSSIGKKGKALQDALQARKLGMEVNQTYINDLR